ncbi:hypothetical protein [Proteiniphilum sp. UBA1028]|uniref:hypothetical protein n=1 Tax=Proteiniphilum sp. UBA1028 TaxID=1947251 RepID=UPI0025ED90BF|nr:hypothetical protein [Proteiniphilum sp. UBA1028]
MRSVYIFLLWLVSFFAGAQGFTYDTIRVSRDDARNIHHHKPQHGNDKGKTASIEHRNMESNRPSFFEKSKLRFGANLGLSVSRNYTRLGLGPQIGYQFNPRFMAGTGIKYYYSKASTTEYTVKDNLLGANIFGYFYPVSFVAAFAQPELNYIWSDLTQDSTTETLSHSGLVPSLIVGAGFRVGRSHITLNYDLVKHTYSPHPTGVYLGVSAFF